MSGFNFDLDIEAELAGIRGYKEKSEKQSRTEPSRQGRPDQDKHVLQSEPGYGIGQSSNGRQVVSERIPEPQTPSHSHGGEDTSPPVNEPIEKKETSFSIDWKRFKTMPGIFEHVGGDRPVRLNPSIKKSQVSGIPESMLGAVQKRLKEKHMGAVVGFPWGEYEITEKNRVFTTKSSLLRYLLFDAFRDAEGTHIQYAKQWMVLQHPVFDKGFNPKVHLGSASDELDIYALLFVAHTSENYQLKDPSETLDSELDYQTAERIGMLNMSIGRVLDKLNDQENLFRAYAERNTVMQTVMLLDRLGLLDGGLPKDIGEFVRVLEENREALAETDVTVSDHIRAEKERKKTLARQDRMRQMQQRRTRRQIT